MAALAELIDALDGGGALRSDGTVGRRSLEMVEAVYRSQLAANQPVRFPLAALEKDEGGVAALRRAGQFVERSGG